MKMKLPVLRKSFVVDNTMPFGRF